jgi:hypothetical protein
MFDYDDGVLFAVIAACLYTEDLSLATGGPSDPHLDVQPALPASEVQTFVQVRNLTLSKVSGTNCTGTPARKRIGLASRPS